MTERQSSLIAAVAMAAMFAVGVAFGIALDHRVLHRRPPRSEFGMEKYLPNLGDEVKLSIQSEANLAQ